MESIKAKGLSVFKDNAKGSVTFVAWRRKIITHAEEWGGETAKQVMLGELAGVHPDENKEKCNRMYVDLVYNLDKRIYSDDRYTSLRKMLGPDPYRRPSAASLLGEIGRIVTMQAAANASRAAMAAASDAELGAGKAGLAHRQCKHASTQAWAERARKRSRRAWVIHDTKLRVP